MNAPHKPDIESEDHNWDREYERDYEPNNRPQDGRICDCEDAPCCGCYTL